MVQIDPKKFQITHKAFLNHMEEEGDGVPFTGFGYRFFVSNEVSYKQETLRRARKIVQFSKWNAWSKKPGRIVEALKEVCKPAVSSNLMEHRYGEKKNSYSALYKLDSMEDLRAFEEHVQQLYSVIQHSDDQIAPVFDELAKHLHEKKLGCKWDFVAYLLFLMRPERFFPIKSSKFEAVLRFWGIDAHIQYEVSWERSAASWIVRKRSKS
mgnify:CR=1 FL=1